MLTPRWVAVSLIAGVLGTLALSAALAADAPSRSRTKPAPGPAPTPPVPGLPVLQLGALLPLAGPSAWFGEEMRNGMELAISDLNPTARRPGPPAASNSSSSASTSNTASSVSSASSASASSEADATSETRATPTIQILLETLDVQPANVKDATADFTQLTAKSVPVVFTASPTPTLAIFPLAAARDILVVHQGLPSDRLPASSRTLLQTRPSIQARMDALAAYAQERGFRRLALLAAGDEFGKAARAALTERWREPGQSLAHAESLSLDAADVPSRLRRLARLAPDAVCLFFQGADLGEVAQRLRDAGYAGPLIGLDDDPAAILAAGPSLTDMVVLADAFVSVPKTRAAHFAQAYRAKYGRAPSRFAANAYDAVSIIAEGVRLALTEGRGMPGGARLREALLAQRTFPSVYGGEVRIRDDGSFERPLALFSVERGREVFVRYLAATR